MATVPSVPVEIWSDLYKVSEDFRDLAPWEFMEGGDVFGVVNPEKQEAGYCCVMGQLGEVFGMAVYLGSEGLALLEELFAEEGPANPADAVLRKNCLMVEYVGSGEVEKEDKAVLKKLGLKYKGRSAWPIFRSLRPGAAPWFLEEWEARFLTVILQQAIDVCARVRAKPDLLTPSRDELYFVRVPESKDGKIEWNDRWVEPEPYKKPELPKLAFDEIRFATAKKKAKHVDLVWEMELTMVPMPVMDRDRPYFLRFFMIVDRKSGYMFNAEPMDPFKCNELLLPKILDIIEKTGVMPKTVLFRNGELRSLLNDPLERMGIEAKLVRELPVVDKAYEGMMQFFGKR